MVLKWNASILFVLMHETICDCIIKGKAYVLSDIHHRFRPFHVLFENIV